MHRPQSRLTRRGFLLAAACAPALAVAAIAARHAQEPLALSAQSSPPQPDREAGYHETEHIRSYYRSAAF